MNTLTVLTHCTWYIPSINLDRLYFNSEEYKLMITTSNCLFISVEKILAEHPFDVVQQLEFTLQTLLAVSLRSFDSVEKLAPDGQ